MSMPFDRKRFTFIQPDGSKLPVVGSGDQHHAVFQTEAGYTVVRNPESGYFEYATVSQDHEQLQPSGLRAGTTQPPPPIPPGVRVSRSAAKAKAREGFGLPPGTSRWEARRRERKAIERTVRAARAAGGILPAPPQRTTVGDYVGLCLLVQFPDVPATISRDEVDAYCNQPGYTGFGNNGSVYDYFLAQSLGELRYKNIVAPYYTAKHARSYYTNESIPQATRARELIKEAIDHLESQDFDFDRLTVDEQGYVYAMNVFYSGPVVNNWAQGLWPHSYRLLTPRTVAPGKALFDYQITNMGAELSLGTFCHENGHMICDFPDLYDYGYESYGVGIYCLMCGGTSDEKNPAHVGAYLKYKAGWSGQLTKIKPGSDLSAIAHADKNEFFVHSKNDQEYFILENRLASGRDSSLPSSGLAIWHVDEEGDNSNEQMTPTDHYECALVQADGKTDLEDRNNNGDASDFFAQGGNAAFGTTTQPASRWWDGTASTLEVTEIGASGNVMTFRTTA